MSKEALIDKSHAYLNNRFFPWNFIVEPVSEEAIRHYVKYAIPIGPLKTDAILVKYDISHLKDAIEEEVYIAINDFLVDPTNKHARRAHGKFADDYPFAYTKGLIFSILYELGMELEDVVDVDSLLQLVGVSNESFDRMKSVLKRSLYIQRSEVKPGIPFTSIINRDVIHPDGTKVGILKSVKFDPRLGYLTELLIKPRKNARYSVYRRSGKHIIVPMDEVRLTNVYNNHITLRH
ncbi:MAG: PRC-barrel domain-containing protein [Halobacteriota archaeon]|nr:PRC-barrel domain-containing protein [Halobacteriota archaeon]